MPLSELAELTAWLPAGSVLWQATGGELARSREEQTLHLIDLHIRQHIYLITGKNGPQPKYPKPPPDSRERHKQQRATERKAAAWARRHQEGDA